MTDSFDAIIIGGGFFGTYLSVHLAGQGSKVLVVEREAELFRRASTINQARIHRGYHYPRSVLTGLRSAVNFNRFVDDFRASVDVTTPTYYAIARQGSNVTAAQFQRFCETVGAPLRPPPAAVERLFDPMRIEAVYAVEEYVFDAVRLREEMTRRLEGAGVELALSTEARVITPEGNRARVTVAGAAGQVRDLRASRVFVCAYSATNTLLKRSGSRGLPLKHELVEMALIEPPEELRGMGVTVMCGPFFSVMPFPSRGLHTFSHVRYTPHYSWTDQEPGTRDPYEVLERWERRTRFVEMARDAARYLPALGRGRYAGSLWEVKTVLMQSEGSDSRPILYVQLPDAPAVIYITGAKIDNVYDACDVYDATHATVPV